MPRPRESAADAEAALAPAVFPLAPSAMAISIGKYSGRDETLKWGPPLSTVVPDCGELPLYDGLKHRTGGGEDRTLVFLGTCALLGALCCGVETFRLMHTLLPPCAAHG